MFLYSAMSVELRDDSEGGIGNIADVLIKQGLVTATEQVCLYRNLNTFLDTLTTNSQETCQVMAKYFPPG